SFDGFCCSTEWDGICADIAMDECVSACECVADCTDKQCGDNGCFGSCGECGAGDTCVADGTCCTPQCDGKSCGDDGCGGDCGDCELGESCTPTGLCEPAACCSGNDCCEDNGTPGCSAPLIEACVCGIDSFCCDTSWDGVCAGIASDDCVDSCNCAADCNGKLCGDDGCGGSCGVCADGLGCDATGQCVSCVPDCGGKDCGDDGCGGVCGVCTDGNECNGLDLCVPAGSCDGACGGEAPEGCFCDDTCFGFGDCCANICEFCPDQAPGNECGVCVIDCAGKECGDDGCGGVCGSCDAGDVCTDAQVCETPDDSCEGDCGTFFGSSACNCDESCFTFGDCCADICTFCAAEFPDVEPDGCGVCVADCAGKNCGSDGCGGTCGECSGTDTCGVDGTCAACVPTCGGAECGADGCGGVCGTCDADEGCVSGVCESASCEGNCGLLAATGCGCDDFCFSIGDCCEDVCTFCPSQAPGDECGACEPACDGKNCGDDGCGSTCGECGATETCGLAGTCEIVECCKDNNCCTEIGTPGCTDAGLEACVCDLDDFCCSVNWDDLCAASAVEDCSNACTGPCVPACDGKNCGDDGCGGSCGTCGVGQECVVGTCQMVGCGNATCDFGENCSNCPDDCGACSGECCTAHATSGCDEPAVSACVCAVDSFCCTEAWDPTCVTVAENNCTLDCATSECGDTTCDPEEDCVTCPGDCGFCPPQPGDLVITEILATPVSAAQVTEWFEILNVSSSPINLAGLQIKDKGVDNVTLPATPVVINPDQYLAIGRTVNIGGGLTADIGLSNKFFLAASDSIILVMNGQTIDEVTYSAALGFPSTTGSSMSLDPKAYFGNNSLASNWCSSQTVYGSGPDLGTPRAGNEPCSQLATCTMDFEGTNCPTTKLVCGGSSVGGSCALGIPPTCAPSGVGLTGFRVVPGTPANLSFVDAIRSVKVSFASADAVPGTMVFRNFLGGTVATLTTNGTCTTGAVTTQSITFSEPVYGVNISAGAGGTAVWVDGLQINAP
ncbi:MAG: lamin tail domain-containing protein, partial [Myxococcota bacterium]